MTQSLLLALTSTIVFALASISFSFFAQKLSANWMNAFKATVSLVLFSLVVLINGEVFRAVPFEIIAILFLSGLVGLNIGDFFLFKAFQRIGPARTLMIFSFQPLFMAVFAYAFFGQGLTLTQAIAVLFLIGCSLTISYEKFKTLGAWELLGPLFAFLGVLLDCLGVVMTREAFEQDPELSVMLANFYRCLGAGAGFLLIGYLFPIKFKMRFIRMPLRGKLIVLAASIFGTFVALYLYLAAIEMGHLGKISAIVGSGPLFTTIFEAIANRKWPTKYLWVSLGLFGLGSALLIFD